MSARLDMLLDKTRLADCIANDTAMGLIPAPAVEFDEAFFARVDASEPTAAQKAARNDSEAMRIQLRMQDVRDAVGGR